LEFRVSSLGFDIIDSDFVLRISNKPKNLNVWVYLPQVEQLVAAHPPQDELAVLLNFPPLEKAKADIIRSTFLLLHLGHTIFSEEFKTNFSNSCLQRSQ
jgi:hypothetical protein